VGTIAETYVKYPATAALLPAMGYSDQQVRDLEETIRRTPVDVVLIATPIDLRRLIHIDKPALRVRYDLQEIGEPTLRQVLGKFVAGHGRGRSAVAVSTNGDHEFADDLLPVSNGHGHERMIL
jgi:predicted GTPase